MRIEKETTTTRRVTFHFDRSDVEEALKQYILTAMPHEDFTGNIKCEVILDWDSIEEDFHGAEIVLEKVTRDEE